MEGRSGLSNANGDATGPGRNRMLQLQTIPPSCEAARAAPAGRFRARAAAGRGGGDAPARAERPQRASQLRAPREEGGPALRHI